MKHREISKRPTVVAIYCPLWHSYPHMNAWKGEGWTEWELLKTAPPRFKGHHQPLRPTWGCFDESDPKWSAKEIDLAADHGIDVMLIDWYWYSGVKIMEEALESGFLRAPNRKRLKFALMWANHDWGDYFPPPYKGPWNSWLPIRHTPRDFRRVMDYCLDHYFCQPNYWRIEGQLFFSLFQGDVFVDQLGGVEKTRRILRETDRMLNARGFPAIHWNGMTGDTTRTAELKAAGFATTTCYNVLASGKAGPGTDLIDQYEDVMAAHRETWHALHRAGGAYLPVVTTGWDVTPRCRHDEPWPFRASKENGVPGSFVPFESAGERKGKLRYPYIHVVVGNTPKRFERLCRDSVRFLDEVNSAHRVVILNAWNEWTEGCYLLPEKRYGDGYLKAVQSAFGMPDANARP